MPLQTNNKPATIDSESFQVAFGMLNGAQDVGCRVSSEALQDNFGAGGTTAELIGAFNSNRRQIELVASRKFDRGQTSNGIVRITTADF